MCKCWRCLYISSLLHKAEMLGRRHGQSRTSTALEVTALSYMSQHHDIRCELSIGISMSGGHEEAAQSREESRCATSCLHCMKSGMA
jgi:hypothetical protein